MLVAKPRNRYYPENTVVAFGMLLIVASFILSGATNQPPRPEFIGAGTTFVLGGGGLAVAQELQRRRNGGD